MGVSQVKLYLHVHPTMNDSTAPNEWFIELKQDVLLDQTADVQRITCGGAAVVLPTATACVSCNRAAAVFLACSKCCCK
jgi:hypothetical protein